VLCLAQSVDDLLTQTAAVLASGGTALWPDAQASLRAQLPTQVQAQVVLQDNALNDGTVELDAVLHHGDAASLQAVCAALAHRAGPIVGVTALQPGAVEIPLERLLIERALSVNTAAAGGNASLMTIG
jgi:RHH-type proline utilization regulon transcriptional repressor/proline dehydrogenase/delta 1-pyrroline-5-carboxylate dehydrogenase